MSDGSIYWDPFDPALRDDPYPLWKRMRDEAPLYRNDRYDFWVLSRFDDVETAHKDPATFSSAHMTTIEMMTPEPLTDTGMFIGLDPPDAHGLPGSGVAGLHPQAHRGHRGAGPYRRQRPARRSGRLGRIRLRPGLRGHPAAHDHLVAARGARRPTRSGCATRSTTCSDSRTAWE